MWLGIIFVSLLIGVNAASVYEEGGGRGSKIVEYPDTDGQYDQEEALRQKYLQELYEQEQVEQQEEAERQIADEIMREARIQALMGELQEGYEKMKMEEAEKEIMAREVPQEKIPVAPKGQPEEAKEQLPKQEEQIDESAESQPTDKAPTAQKKGQSEFVSFIDPDQSKQTKSVLTFEKRTIEQVRMEKLNQGGHLLFLAVGCVMIVGMVGALVGGVVKYRKNREEPDDQEYAPYAGTGPRSKKPIKGEKGDEALAYKAQLHHYQQSKQKIICGEDNAGVAGESDDETDEVDDENNFSVYECPGLAPTGDIEVHNPNFAGDRP